MINQLPKKKIVISLVVVAVLLLIGELIFGGPPKDNFFSRNSVGPPPEDPQTRLAWLSENVDNNDRDTFVRLDYKVPSWKELNKLNTSLPKRNYPRYIKATQTYGTLPNLVEVLYFGDVLKDLGINTQFVHANYWLRNGEFKLWYTGYDQPQDMNQDEAKRALVHNILLAKQQGLAVILFPDYVQLEDGGMKKHSISNDLEDRFETIALDLAKIAEEYNVEYFVPVNQIETILDTNGYPVNETQNRTNAFYANVVPKVRSIYSGKVFYKMGGFSKWKNFDGISLKGADIFGFTVCSRSPSPNVVSSEVKASTQQASKMSKQYGIPWIGAEFLIENTSDQTLRFGEVKTDYPIEENYQAGLTAFNQYGSSASGFTVHSLLGGGKIYDTPAFPLIKTFFASKP